MNENMELRWGPKRISPRVWAPRGQEPCQEHSLLNPHGHEQKLQLHWCPGIFVEWLNGCSNSKATENTQSKLPDLLSITNFLDLWPTFTVTSVCMVMVSWPNEWSCFPLGKNTNMSIDQPIKLQDSSVRIYRRISWSFWKWMWNTPEDASKFIFLERGITILIEFSKILMIPKKIKFLKPKC